MEYVREKWVAASGGQLWKPRELLEHLIGELPNHAEPWILFDLDHTLLETVKRTHQIVMEAAERLTLPDELAERLRRLQPATMGFSLQDTFSANAIPVTDEQFIRIREYWWERFFGEDYLHFDEAFPGAVAFVQRLYEAGAHLCYLTARTQSRMGVGTEATLERLGFPWKVPRVTLHMKQDDGSDHGHKASVKSHLPPTATVIASFENEPRNIVELSDTFPEAIQVFLDTKCSQTPARAVPGVWVLKEFR